MKESERKQLEKTIKDLKLERDSLPETQAENKERIDTLIKDIRYHIDHPEDVDHAKRLKNNLPDLIKIFEIKHPVITDIINKVSLILSNMGI